MVVFASICWSFFLRRGMGMGRGQGKGKGVRERWWLGGVDLRSLSLFPFLVVFLEGWGKVYSGEG